MEKVKLKIEAIRTILNYVSIVLFGTWSYLFINFDALSGFKMVICATFACVSLGLFAVLIAFYIGIIWGL